MKCSLYSKEESAREREKDRKKEGKRGRNDRKGGGGPSTGGCAEGIT